MHSHLAAHGDMKSDSFTGRNLGWRWIAVGLLFVLGFIAFAAGVNPSQRPEAGASGLAVQAYYILGLFVVGGLDLGVPEGGPVWARALLWITYFGAPLLTASAAVEAVIRIINPRQWVLRNLRDHIVIFGSGELTISYLRMLRKQKVDTRIIIVDTHFDPIREQELQQKYGALTLVGDLTLGFLLEQLQLHRAKRALLLGDNDFQAFEAATRILGLAPNLRFLLVVHCHNLRFMRTILRTKLGRHCIIFNTYHLAALGFVRNDLIPHFRSSPLADNVVIAGFGRFGQSVLEQLQKHAGTGLSNVALIDQDAERRVMVVQEQEDLGENYRLSIFVGDISHPDVWRRLSNQLDLSGGNTTFILGTGDEHGNIRTALWLKQKYPQAAVFARSNAVSKFALAVAEEKSLNAFSITQLVENMIPDRWTS